MKRTAMVYMTAFLAVTAATAEIATYPVEYEVGGQAYIGYMAYDASTDAPRPGVLVVHEWYGLNDYAKRRARELAELGYAAFALDMYGNGTVGEGYKEAAALSGPVKADRPLMRRRARAGLDVLRNDPITKGQSVAAIGYCFGGTVVLELARDNAPLAGVVSFHGGLETPMPATEPIQPEILVLHGADDPHVPAEEVEAFKKEMDDVEADYTFIAYPGAVHAFTNPDAGDDPSKGAAYNEEADKKSWEAMKGFLEEVLGR